MKPHRCLGRSWLKQFQRVAASPTVAAFIMGAGASAESKDIGGKLEEKELKEFLKNMDAETAMKLGKAMDAAGTKGKNMKRAIWLWGEEEAKEFLEELEITSKVPEKLDGKKLLLDEGEWEKEEDKEKAKKTLMKVAFKFAEDVLRLMSRAAFVMNR
eukprot:Skav233325  [mRNA]  locus=scaffold2558:158661:162079:+ [translate_table: standard]